MNRIHHKVNVYFQDATKRAKEMILCRYFKKAVDKNANGTRKYVIKAGANKKSIIMPLNAKGKKVLKELKEQYGAKKGTAVFYAMEKSGKLKNVTEKKKTSRA